ncbi:MAG: WecB/TagA/CpsF family glycosyltransferase [Candidatus Omnitrophica bacterium]|nr:WecB/TagA/CpsF family glycosyltransferase [Candidatus Omnitrophota bacterium]
MNERIYIQNVNIHNITSTEALEYIEHFLSGDKKKTIGYVNAHCINVARHDEDYRDVINSFDLVIPDGIGVSIAGFLKNCPVAAKLSATDFFSRCIEEFHSQGKKFFLVGAKPEIITKVCSNLREKYPEIQISGYHHGYDAESNNEEICRQINACKPDIVLVAMGAPKQEKWISNNKDKIDAKVFIGVGGLFDFIAGANKRAPIFMRKTGLEWVYRIYQEPKRMWKRYILGNPKFLYYAVLETMKGYRKSPK